MIFKKMSREEKKLFESRLFIYIIVLQFLFMGVYAFFSEPKAPFIGFILIFLTLFPLYLFFCDWYLFFRKNSNNKIILFGANIFLKIINFVLEKLFQNRRRKKLPFKRVLAKLIFISVLFILPTLLIILSIQGYWQINSMGGSGTNTINNSTNIATQNLAGTLSLKPHLKNNILRELSYVLGSKLDYPLLDICFSNEKLINKRLDYRNFKNYVKIEEETIVIPFNSSICRSFQNDDIDITYDWNVEYKYFLSKNDTVMNDFGTFPLISRDIVTVRINDKNLLLTYLIILLGWWAICLLVMNIFKKLEEI
jgi:hypothetical protein